MHVPAFRSFLLLAFTWSFVAASAIDAKAAGSISGRVVDPDGRPVAGARVLVSGSGTPLQSVVTTEDGRFSMPAPEGSRLTVRVAADGFRAEAVDINGSSEATNLGTITLAISALSESIVVSASQVEVPLTDVTSSVTIISGAELEARQIHTVADALRMVPGLTVSSTGGVGTNTAVFPRGGESNFTLALIDGVPANSFGGDFDFAQVPTANIERIEIVRGPQSALFGANAIGAVVQIVSRRGGPPTGRVSFEGGGFDTSRVTASTTGQHRGFEWGASYDRLASDGQNGELTAAGEEIVNDDYERHAGTASAGWREGNFWVRADARHSTDERGFPGPFGSNPIGAYEGIDNESRGRNNRTQASVSTSVPVSPRVRAQGLFGHNRLESDFDSPFGPSESFSRRWLGRMQADVAIVPGVDLSAGVELQRERTGSTFITGSSFQQIPVERSTAGYFGEARWNWNDRVFAATGIRIEDIRRDSIEASGSRPPLPADTVVSVNPRASVGWLARDAASNFTKVRGAVGTGIRPPDGFELAFTDNPELRPERSFSVEAGVDQAFASGRGLMEATAFFNEYDDLIVAVGSFVGSSRFQTDNISNARASGLELAVTLRGRIAWRRPVDLTGRVGYTRLATKILAVDQDDAAPPPFEVGQPLLRRPDHQFFTDLSASVGGVTAFLRGGGRSEALDVEPSFGTFGGLFKAEGYNVWHLGASWRATQFAEVFGRIENLFDRSYEEAFGFPALGRRATIGLRLVAGR
jgi:outer membrane cobalamin receptor